MSTGRGVPRENGLEVVSQPRAESAHDVVDVTRGLLSSVQEGVERADQKASIFFTSMSLLIAVLVVVAPRVLDWATEGPGVRWLVPALGGLSVVSLACAGGLAAWSVYPRLGPSYSYQTGNIEPGDLIYFGRLRLIPPEDLAVELRGALADGSILDHLCEQLITSAKICWEKHVALQRALRAAGLAGVFGALALLVWMLLGLAQ